MPKKSPDFIENDPAIGWGAKLQAKSADSHKYDHGHVVVMGGRRMTGAGCLASVSALRMGAGLCTVVAPAEAASIYRIFCPSLMVSSCEEIARFKDHLADSRCTVAVIGPGAGLDNPGGLKKAVMDIAQMQGKVCVIDADALTVFADKPALLRSVTHENCILTPHDGEFARIFPELADIEDRAEKAQQAALLCRAIVVLKGKETVIASPQGGCVINTNGSGWLATAGTGDVLAGMIAGLAARELPELSLFGSVCAAVWMHAEIGSRFGAGLISADMPGQIPELFSELLGRSYGKRQSKAPRPKASKGKPAKTSRKAA